jgi:hypothetical protein
MCTGQQQKGYFGTYKGLKIWSYVTRSMVNGYSNLLAYSDADWASDPEGRRSCTGYVTQMLGRVISWGSKRQPIYNQLLEKCALQLHAKHAIPYCWKKSIIIEQPPSHEKHSIWFARILLDKFICSLLLWNVKSEKVWNRAQRKVLF